MKVLVTGGSGFIGSAVVRALLQHGQAVRALVRTLDRPGNLAGLDVELIEGDVLDRQSLDRALQGCQRQF